MFSQSHVIKRTRNNARQSMEKGRPIMPFLFFQEVSLEIFVGFDLIFCGGVPEL